MMMSQQLVEVAVINKLLGLPLQSKAQLALTHINQLVIFRQNHQYSQSIINSLQNEVIKIKIHMESQMANYLHEKTNLAMDKLQAQAETRKKQASIARQLNVSSIPSSLQEFMQNQLQCRFAKIQKLTIPFKITRHINIALKPHPPLSELKTFSKENPNSRMEHDGRKGQFDL